jgi:hypothetical protein
MLDTMVENIVERHEPAAAAPFAALRSAAARRTLYALLAVLGFIGTSVVTVGRMVMYDATFNVATGDGKDYYVYLPSVLVDHDLDLSNQMRDHYGREFEQSMLENRTPLGYVADKYPIGVALTLAPPAILAHMLCVPLHRLTGCAVFVPDGYSLLYQLLALAWIEVLGFCTLAMIDTLLIAHVCEDGRWVALGITCVALGSAYGFHFFTNPLAAHTVSVFWVSAVMILSMRLIEDAGARRLSAKRVAVLSFCLAMAIVTRPTDVLVAPFLLLALWHIARNGLLPRALALLPLAILCSAPILLQLWVWHRMTGAWITFSYQGERFYFTHPQLWQTILSSRNGLFWWSPMLLLATIGLVWELVKSRAARRNELVLCAIASFVILWYFNSAWWSWWFGESWGGRAFVEISVLFMIGMTWLIRRISTLSNDDARRAWIGAIGGSIIWTTILLGFWYTKQIPRSDYFVPSWRILKVNHAPASATSGGSGTSSAAQTARSSSASSCWTMPSAATA